MREKDKCRKREWESSKNEVKEIKSNTLVINEVINEIEMYSRYSSRWKILFNRYFIIWMLMSG